jgi:hypothetical protein
LHADVFGEGFEAHGAQCAGRRGFDEAPFGAQCRNKPARRGIALDDLYGISGTLQLVGSGQAGESGPDHGDMA